jgi:2-iminobutanoate/2-iminopropanoate deaminase
VAASTAAEAPAPVDTAASGDFLNRYTQATRYGDLLFVSGQIAIDPNTGAFDSRQRLETQAAQALGNIRAILEANHLTLANVVFVTVYLKDISDLPTLDLVYHNLFKATPPARSVVQIQNLPRGASIEISAIAGR